MTICETGNVDFCWRDKTKTDKLFLAFIDHLDWENEDKHLKLLQDKLNTYLSYLDNDASYIEENNRKIFIKQSFHKFEIRIIFEKNLPSVVSVF